jgi:hypothetical protein
VDLLLDIISDTEKDTTTSPGFRYLFFTKSYTKPVSDTWEKNAVPVVQATLKGIVPGIEHLSDHANAQSIIDFYYPDTVAAPAVVEPAMAPPYQTDWIAAVNESKVKLTKYFEGMTSGMQVADAFETAFEYDVLDKDRGPNSKFEYWCKLVGPTALLFAMIASFQLDENGTAVREIDGSHVLSEDAFRVFTKNGFVSSRSYEGELVDATNLLTKELASNETFTAGEVDMIADLVFLNTSWQKAYYKRFLTHSYTEEQIDQMATDYNGVVDLVVEAIRGSPPIRTFTLDKMATYYFPGTTSNSTPTPIPNTTPITTEATADQFGAFASQLASGGDSEPNLALGAEPVAGAFAHATGAKSDVVPDKAGPADKTTRPRQRRKGP